jgi:hypothetical protein
MRLISRISAFSTIGHASGLTFIAPVAVFKKKLEVPSGPYLPAGRTTSSAAILAASMSSFLVAENSNGDTTSSSQGRHGLEFAALAYALVVLTHKHRPRIRLTIRQRMRVLDEWPRHETFL